MQIYVMRHFLHINKIVFRPTNLNTKTYIKNTINTVFNILNIDRVNRLGLLIEINFKLLSYVVYNCRP